ncbi:MAG: hypothetical protein P1V20_29495 [Verrucomicrobiales bacterium]|nr:hypothetical protein [Verrucomicrobiales bacterium]
MLAKPLKDTAVDARFENIVKPAFVADGETAWAKRTQGIHQAAGRFAPSSRLIQPRKQLGSGSQSGNVTGWQQSMSRTMASGIGFHRGFHPGRIRSWRGEREAYKMNWNRKERLNPAPRTREASPPSFTRDRKVIDDQLREDIIGSGEESDSPIVVRDGKTDHTLREATAERALAKGWAEGQSEHSTHVGKGLFPLDVSRSLFAFETKVTTLGESPGLHARLSEEPIAGKPHDGICEGDAG